MGENPDRGHADGLPVEAHAMQPPRPVTRPVEPPEPLKAPETATPDEGLRAALEATTRTEASLSALMRAVAQVTTGVTGAQEANERLALELEKVRELLASTNEQRLALRNRVATLEETLRRNEQARLAERDQAERERTFLVGEQDKFLSALLEEHDEQVAQLKAEIANLRKADEPSEKPTLPGIPVVEHEENPAASPVIDELRRQRDKLLVERERSREILRRIQEQRDHAQQQLDRLRSERDEARAEVSRLSALLDAPPELSAELSAQNARRLHPTPTALSGRRTDPQKWRDPSDGLPDVPALELGAPGLTPRISAPELPLVHPESPAVSNTDLGSRPPPAALLRRQDPSHRPLGGYSVQPEDGELMLAPPADDGKPSER